VQLNLAMTLDIFC